MFTTPQIKPSTLLQRDTNELRSSAQSNSEWLQRALNQSAFIY